MKVTPQRAMRLHINTLIRFLMSVHLFVMLVLITSYFLPICVVLLLAKVDFSCSLSQMSL